MYQKFSDIHDVNNLPKRKIEVECRIKNIHHISLETLDTIDLFRPFGIGNRKPLFLLEDETINDISPLGKDGKHLQLRLQSIPHVKCIMWNPSEELRNHLQNGNIVSLIVELDRNEWNGKQSVSILIKDICI